MLPMNSYTIIIIVMENKNKNLYADKILSWNHKAGLAVINHGCGKGYSTAAQ